MSHPPLLESDSQFTQVGDWICESNKAALLSVPFTSVRKVGAGGLILGSLSHIIIGLTLIRGGKGKFNRAMKILMLHARKCYGDGSDRKASLHMLLRDVCLHQEIQVYLGK